MSRVKELIKLAMDSMKEQTLRELLSKDEEYKKGLEAQREAFKAFTQLELTEKQRNVVETLIAAKDEIEYDYKVNCYMAGMLDAYEILKLTSVTDE